MIVIEPPAGPEIVLDGPATETIFEDSAVVSGRVHSERAVSAFVLTLGGDEISGVTLTEVDGGYAFSATVPLVVGDNLVAAKAVDDLDRSAGSSRTIVRTLDQAAPRVAVTWPRDGHGVRTRALVVRGTIEDERAVTSATMELGEPGEPLSIDEHGNFQAAITLAPGTNTYRIRVVDASGNEAILEQDVYFGQRIGAGGAHSGFLLDGALYAWGRNQKGQVGLGYTSVLAALFEAARCSACHRATLATGPVPGQPLLAGQTFHPYTDLLLHDMGSALADAIAEGDAAPAEWRTAPLWGLGLVEQAPGARFLHDGRATSLEDAILWHGGEAEAARAAFAAMSRTDRDALLAFVRSL